MTELAAWPEYQDDAEDGSAADIGSQLSHDLDMQLRGLAQVVKQPESRQEDWAGPHRLSVDQAVRGGDSLEQYMIEIGRTPLLKASEEQKLAKAIESGDISAFEHMIQ